MADPTRFLNAAAQALATMALYKEGHPARERASAAAFERLREIMSLGVRPAFSFLDGDVIYGTRSLRDMRGWEWGAKLASVGIERLEVVDNVPRQEFDELLQEIFWRLNSGTWTPEEERALAFTSVRIGTVGVRGDGGGLLTDDLPVADTTLTLVEETDAVRWVYDEAERGRPVAIAEAEAVISSLALAMHGDAEILLPLLQLTDYDQYVASHSINVSVLAMALAEFRGLSAPDVRAIGVAGLLHDIGMIHIPREILHKPDQPTAAEWEIIRRHPLLGAQMILASEPQVDIAAVVAYEHHLLLNGSGYPALHYPRQTHYASRLIQICDRYDSLRTRRPFRDVWSSEKALEYVETRAGTEFEPDLARAFVQMVRQWDHRLLAVPHGGSVVVPPALRYTPQRGSPVVSQTPTSVPSLPQPSGDAYTHY